MAKIKELKINFRTITKKIKLSNLKLDLRNVRFQHLSKKLDDKEMDKLIWEEPSTKELCEQIKSAGGLYEEPIVDSNYVVLEGNRRLVCLRHLQAEAHAGKLPNFDKNIFDIIKSRMVPDHISDMDKHLLLATIHVKGKKDWPSFNKAKQIDNLNRDHKISYDQLAKYLAMGKVTVIRMVKSYEQTLKYGQRYPEEKGWYRRYSYFEQLFTRLDLKEFSKLQENVDKFSKWIHENKFKDYKDIAGFGQILIDEDAMRTFELYNFAKAFALLQERNPALKSREFRQIQKAVDVIHNFPRRELIKTLSDPYRKAIIRKLKKEIDSLVKDIDTLERKK